MKLWLLPQPLASKLLIIGNDTLNLKKQKKKGKTKPGTESVDWGMEGGLCQVLGAKSILGCVKVSTAALSLRCWKGSRVISKVLIMDYK